ncbi:MAG: hypothetical protein U1F36_12405 [Planctomycetota bacterium]
MRIAVALVVSAVVHAQDLATLPVIEAPLSRRASTDWLIDPSPFVARLGRSADGRDLVLDNGLVRRTWRPTAEAACIGFDDLMRGETLLRAVREEGSVTIDGVDYPIGGLVGAIDQAFLPPDAIDRLKPVGGALRFLGWSSGPVEARIAWKRVRHAAPDAVWPPKGVHLRLEFGQPAPAAASEPPRDELLRDGFRSLDGWTEHRSGTDPRSSCCNEGKPGEVLTPTNTACYLERTLDGAARAVTLTLDCGTDRAASFGPGLAVDFAGGSFKFNLRPGGSQDHEVPEFGFFDGDHERCRVGDAAPFDLGRPLELRMRWDERTLTCEARQGDGAWRTQVEHDFDRPPGTASRVRIGKLDPTGKGSDFGSPGEAVRLHLLSFAAFGAAQPRPSAPAVAPGFRVTVHYDLYDGIPVFAKWLEVHNDTDHAIRVDRFASETLAVVEHANFVETRDGAPLPTPQNLHVETDFAFGGFNFENANRHVVHWREDPRFTTQVNYLMKMPCLLVVEPPEGPAQSIAPGAHFTSFHTFELAHDSLDRERMGLGLRRMYRTIAPWVTENPLMMHMRDARPDRVRAAIDQCADVGFEMLILSFGSGFDMEDDSPANLGRWKEVADYARQKGVEIGGYSLLSSRHIGGGNDVVSPAGQQPTHGSCPSLTSEWGLRYMAKLRSFFPATGFTLLEHDGPYPGDVDVTPRPPLQQGEVDSRWVQWRIASGFYEWCRAEGIYVNAPDHYFLNGTSKCGMGYREVNWSLPRALQVIHTRQNIYDGTWRKPPSLGWMFVPLTEYQGGGAAATIEPLDEHLDHYDRMITSNLAFGVQACYRGPRLYDTPRTRDLLASRVAWFKQHRDILESDLVHGRRADGRDVDWMLHVNPRLDECGMLVAFNPLDHEVERRIDVDLRYTGLRDRAQICIGDAASRVVELRDLSHLALDLSVPAFGFAFVVIRRP